MRAPASESQSARERPFLREWAALTLIALGGLIAVCTVCWPGFMSPDSVEQLVQARQHTFTDDHPPLMAMIWALTDPIVPGPGGMLLLLNALYWGGLAVSFRYWPLPHRARILAFAFVAVFPPLLVNLGVLWKDILMQGALVCLLAAYLRYRVSHGLVPLILGLVFSLIALGARHNSPPAVWPVLALFVAAHPRWSPRLSRWRRSLGALGISLLLIVVLSQGLSRSLAPFVRKMHFWQTAPLFDLAGMSLRADELLFDPELGMLREGTTLEDIRRAYNPRHSLSLFYCWATPGCPPLIRHTDDPAEMRAVARNWISAVMEHPWAYVESRYYVYRNLIFLTERPYIVYAKIEPNPYGYAVPVSPFRDAVLNGFEWLGTTPLFCIWLYLLVLFALLLQGAVGFLRGGSALALALGASGLLYHATFTMLTASDDYRYSLWTILCTVLTVCALPAAGVVRQWSDLRARLWRQKSYPATAPGASLGSELALSSNVAKGPLGVGKEKG